MTPANSNDFFQVASRGSGLPRWKRTLDLTFVCLVVPALAVVLPFVALVVFTASPGPIFYRQEFVGFHRIRFTGWRLRTTKVNVAYSAHHHPGSGHADPIQRQARMNDTTASCLIRFGAILRATGIAGLPLLFNVWRGEMSLVGPRPCLPCELAAFLPQSLGRFETPPGLIGPQKKSRGNLTLRHDQADEDVLYVRSRCLRGDLTILLRTVVALAEQTARVCRRGGVSNPASAS